VIARPSLLRIAVVATLAAAAAVSPAGASSGPRGTVVRMHMASAAVGDSLRTVRVYLPPSYDRPESRDRRYPVVYLLHGWPGSDGNLLEFGHVNDTADSLVARGAIPEIIMVFPNGSGSGLLGRSYWINSYDGRKRLEDYVTRDLVQWVDAHYRTKPEAGARGIIGISEGGDAAVNLAFRHPDVFSACGGHSGDYVLTRGLGTSAFLGPEPRASEILRENSAALYVDQVAARLVSLHMRIYLDCGTSDDSIENSRAFDRKLTQLHVPHEYREFPGSHTWGYWSHHLRESLIAVAGALH